MIRELKRSIESLKQRYRDGDDADKVLCLLAVEEIDHKSARAFILQVANDRAAPIAARSKAIFSIGLSSLQNLPLLERLALDQSEPSRIRDRAADSIGDMFECRRGSPFRPQAVRVLCKCLDDPDADVRFTACFSLGKMRAKSAVRQLIRVRKEDAGISSCGRVSEQAGFSIDFIQGSNAELGHGAN